MGRMYPNFQAVKMQTNRSTDSPMRKARARAMLLVFAFPSVPSFIMKKSATAKLAMMAKKVIATRYVIHGIIS